MIMLTRTHKRIMQNYIEVLDDQEEEIANLHDLVDNLVDFTNVLLDTGNFNKKVKPSLEAKLVEILSGEDNEQSD